MEVLASSSKPQSNMSRDNTLKDYISKAKIIIEDDKKLKKLIQDVLEKLKDLSNDKKSTEKLNDSLRLFVRIVMPTHLRNIHMFLGRQFVYL